MPLHAHPMLKAMWAVCRSSDVGEVEIGVTLLVGGQWLAGTLISLRKYVDGTVAQLRDAKGNLADAFANGFAAALETSSAIEVIEEGLTGDLSLVLKDVSYWLPNGAVVEVPLLSVRASAVDAFHLGTS